MRNIHLVTELFAAYLFVLSTSDMIAVRQVSVGNKKRGSKPYFPKNEVYSGENHLR